jgi:nitroimidazol reductase NimA-like FMN-containing flavoprotein (pyridoxamine 5'-phosphate oxidase superfamily)
MPEFYEKQILAHHLLSKAPNWWEPGFAKTLKDGVERALVTVYFRVSIDEISGHEGTPQTAV